ncbi:MAG: carboxypeptidase regulatory-like domain-containing protein [Candidatus Hydrogenedentes bacterium]|nr:carboxypeptidase regulatory-like domain-containing protein [Candidatus Hydrogenedentota bacterium]
MTFSTSFLIAAWANLPVSLLHTLWEGALAVAAVAYLLRRISAARPELRYGVCVGGLSAVVLAWLVTWSVLTYEPRDADPNAPMASSFAQPIMTSTQQSNPDPSPVMTNDVARASAPAPRLPWRAWLANAWAAGVCVMGLRALFLIRGAGRLRRTSARCDDEALLALLEELRDAMAVARRVALRVADSVDGPMVMGILSPAILLPAHVLTGVPPEHLRAMLAHELAHIRRHDYLVNLAQMLVESLLFFNPAVWWLSRQIRVEREACCDALAVRHTGSAVVYARVLADFAARTASAPALAMGGAPPAKPLLERILRILTPHARPALRLPWYSLAAFAVVGLALLAGLGGFSYFGVKLVAEAMNPHERIERMAEIQKQFEEPVVDESAKVTVAGTVSTEDGGPLPENLRVKVINLTRNETISAATPVENGKFRKSNVDPRAVYVQAIGDGYAPSLVGPLDTANTLAIENLTVVLQRGRTGLILFTDNRGLPIEGVEVTCTFRIRRGPNYWISAGSQSALSGHDGVARLEHCLDNPVELTVRKPGYLECDDRRFDIPTDNPVTWTLDPMEPVVIHVQAQESGVPIAGAALHVGATSNLHWNQVDGAEKLLATADETGVITLDCLRGDLQYWCYVATDDGRRMKLDAPIVVGQDPLTVTVPPPLYVRGTVLVEPEQLEGNAQFVKLSYPEVFSAPLLTSISEIRSVKVPIKDGRGEFTIDNIFPGELELTVLDHTETLDVQESIDDLVLDLRTSALTEPKKTRTVILRFAVPEGQPAPTGTFRLDYIARPRAGYYSNISLPIENGQVSYEVPVPGKIGYMMDKTVGYWVKHTNEIAVPDGDGPFIVDVPVVPAGTIHGVVHEAPADYSLSVLVAKQSPNVDTPFAEVRPDVDERGAFTCGSLPIGGTYVIMAVSGSAAVMSKPIKLTSAEPIKELDLTFAKGLPVTGTILKPDGTPAPSVAARLLIETEYSHTHSTAPSVEGSAGAFRFDNVNPDLPVTYALEIKPARDYQEVRQIVTPGENVEIRLEPGLTLVGHVIDDATGNPIPGVEVYAFSTQPQASILEADAVTAASGAFRFTRLRDQQYSVGAREVQPISRIEAKAGSTAPIEIRVKIPEWSDLRPAAP